MKLKRLIIAFTGVILSLALSVRAQDSVDVTFRYAPTNSSPTLVFLPGEFNNWGPNSSGVINPSAPSRMEWDPSTVSWTKTVRLRVGYSGGKIPGAYQYKFNEGGSTWLSDPLNPRRNQSDNNNTYLYITNPTIYQLVPNQTSPFVRTSNPVLSAYVFPAVGSTVDSSTFLVRIDGREYKGVGAFYNAATKLFAFRIPVALSNGTHVIGLSAGSVSDSATIFVQAGSVQITSLGNFVTRKPSRTIYGSVEDTSIHTVKITRNGADTTMSAVNAGLFAAQVPFVEGTNTLRAVVRNASGGTQISEPVSFTYLANHAPDADIYLIAADPNVILIGQGSSDPDSGQSSQLKFTWRADANNPQITPGLNGATTSQVMIAAPSAHGDYFFTLIAEDPDGNKDTTRNMFSVLPDGTVEVSYQATSPRWAREGRLYELFFKSMTSQGTIRAAMPYLPYLKSLGVNILWVMPVMENAAPINNRSGPGYNIKNLFKVAPEYGTNDDFKEFIRQAHGLGLRVILDVTPSHTSYLHPFVVEAKQFRQNSPYWDFYQHTIIPHNTNGLGQSITPEGFVHYSGFSDQLLNYNWSDVDARAYMIEVYKWWVKEFDLDGYRLDVYWGPHRRAGGGAGNELEMGVPVRKALKKLKPDIFLLAEDDGTGSGSELIFADKKGGVDAGYDWVLYGGAIKPFSFDAGAIENLHARYYNNDFYPGKNALFLRFMENHDEERIVVSYGGYEKTMPMATTLFTVPGLPMIYSGQEVGFGFGIGDYDTRRRGVINWAAAGRSLLLPHYQRLALIRALAPSLWSQKFIRIPSDNPGVYAYLRPGAAGDVLAAVNFSSNEQDIQVNLSSLLFESTTIAGKLYYFNDLYNDTSYAATFQGNSFLLRFKLRPYGSAIFVKSDSLMRLSMPPIVAIDKGEEGQILSEWTLDQNYPNPFNPGTAIRFRVPATSLVNLKVYDVLGREVATLVDEIRPPGAYAVQWNAGSLPSGVYFYRLSLSGAASSAKGVSVQTRRMLLIK